MSDMRMLKNIGKRTFQTLLLGLSVVTLSACDDLLDVELPHLLTDAAIEGSGTAETQVISAMALFECGMSAFGHVAAGHEDVFESIAGVGSTTHRFRATPVGGTCDTSDSDTSWLDQMMGARAFLSNAPSRLVSTGEGAGQGVYDRLQDEWTLGADGERLSAIASIYMAATLEHFGTFYCEMAFDGSDLVEPDEALALAEDWISDRALVHIGSFGDFALPNSAASSARNLATALRARIRFALGDFTGAVSDIDQVLGADPTFESWITRESGAERRNKMHVTQSAGFSGMLGVNDWWDGSTRLPNPATGEHWPEVIPHTGYIFLGIMPDGRALEEGNTPVRWAAEERDAAEDPVPLDNGAVEDTRILHVYSSIQGPGKRELPAKYSGDADDISFVSWTELILMKADAQQQQGDLAGAIASVNQLRSFHGLPEISGDYETELLADGTAVRHMVLEEYRRELYLDGGRYWRVKIQNNDVLWFPREQGQTPFQGYQLLGGVRLLFDGDEYTQNEHFQQRGGDDARASGCDPLEAPRPNSV